MNRRIKNLRKSLEREKIGGLLLTTPENIRYLTGFFGLVPKEREALVLVTKEGVFLITDSRYIGQVAKLKTLEIRPNEDIFKLISKLALRLKIKRLGFEANNLTFSEYQDLRNNLKRVKIANERLPKSPLPKLVPTKDIIENLRLIKDQDEIKKIKKAVEITDECFENLLRFIRPGLTEGHITLMIEKFIKEKGADLAFPPIVAGGANSAIPHHPSGRQKIGIKDLILLDFGAKFDGYCSDMTRTIFLGWPTSEQEKVYQMVLEAQKLVVRKLSNLVNKKLRIRARDVDQIARVYIKKAGFPDIPHGTGHGVGLCEHEKPYLSPKSKDILRAEMIFTIEPGIYFPGKFGIRIEDLVLLKEGEVKVLTKARKEIIKI